MRYLGIDYGSKRIGLAVSDEEGKFAFPQGVLQNNDATLKEIMAVCTENNIGMIVVGESKNFSGEDNAIMKEAREFANTLGRESGILVEFHPEFLTSVEAERLQGKNDMLDASAAALILKSYLETKQNAHD